MEKRYLTLDIKKHLNSKIVFKSNEIGANQGLDGYGVDEKTFYSFNKTHKIESVPFKFFRQNSNDSIVCNGQKIGIVPDYYTRLHVIGFMYWGSNYDFITFNYLNKEQIKEKIMLYDWSGPKLSMLVNELTSTDDVVTVNKRFELCGRDKGNVYMHYSPFKINVKEKTNFFILPDNMFMHILAMTLET